MDMLEYEVMVMMMTWVVLGSGRVMSRLDFGTDGKSCCGKGDGAAPSSPCAGVVNVTIHNFPKSILASHLLRTMSS
jgi:hypothetical protein